MFVLSVLVIPVNGPLILLRSEACKVIFSGGINKGR